MVKQVTSKDEFNTELANAGSKLVVVDFFATWCGPCKRIAPAIEKMSQENTNVVFLKVDVDEVGDLAAELSVSAMPTFLFFKNPWWLLPPAPLCSHLYLVDIGSPSRLVQPPRSYSAHITDL